MRLLFLLPRINLELVRGDCIYLKRFMEALTEKNEVHAIAHGSSEKIKVHSPGKFQLFERLYTAPYINYLKLKKLNELLKKEKYDFVFDQQMICYGDNLWYKLPALFNRGNSLHSIIQKRILKKNGLRIAYSFFGLTERDSFASFFAGETRQIHLKQLKEADAIIVLSKRQQELLEKDGIKNNFIVFYPSIDTKKFNRKKDCSYIKKKFGLKGFNLILVPASNPFPELNEFFPVLSKTRKEINLVVTCSESKELKELAEKFGLKERVKFVGQVRESGDLIPLLSFCNAGVYLKKFGMPIGDASTAVKISEYMACGLSVLVPEMPGPIEQGGKAGIVLDGKAVERINELYNNLSLRKRLSLKAREKALKEFDLKKNAKKLSKFLENIAVEKR